MTRRVLPKTRPTPLGRALVAIVGALLVAHAGWAEPPDGAPDDAWGDRPPPLAGPMPGPPPGPPPIERILERYADRLQLSDEARAEIDRLARSSHAEIDALRRQLRALHDEMRDLLSQDAPDEARVMAQVDAISAAEAELQKLRLRAMLRIRGLLTPEQRAELVRIHAEHGEPPGPPPPPPLPPRD